MAKKEDRPWWNEPEGKLFERSRRIWHSVMSAIGRPVPPPRRFVHWCRNQPAYPPGQDLNLRGYMKGSKSTESEDTFFETLQNDLHNCGVRRVDINTDLLRRRTIAGKGADDYGHVISHFVLSKSASNLHLANTAVRTLSLSDGHGYLRIKNCSIATLHITGGSSINIQSSYIGTLMLSQASVARLEICGGCILDIECPPPESDNPFKDSVSLFRVFLPRNRHVYFLRSAQPYRNMRHHLKRMENTPMMNLFHSAELAVEREDDRRWNRVVSLFYSLFSDYGSSALRPVLWLFGAYLVSAVTIYCFNGAMIVSPAELTAWKRAVLCDDSSCQIARSLYLAGQAIVNPLQIFGTKAVLEARNGWIFLLLLVQGFFSVIWIALAILAIRRRFKMQ